MNNLRKYSVLLLLVFSMISANAVFAQYPEPTPTSTEVPPMSEGCSLYYSCYSSGTIVDVTADTISINEYLYDEWGNPTPQVVSYTISAETTVDGPLEIGAEASIYYLINADGVKVVTSLYAAYPTYSDYGIISDVVGDVVVIEREVWDPISYEYTGTELVSYTISAETLVDGPLEIGAQASIQYTTPPDGSLVVNAIYAWYPTYYSSGKIVEITDSIISIEEQVWDETQSGTVLQTNGYAINSNTYIDGTPEVGLIADISYMIGSDGVATADYIYAHYDNFYAYGKLIGVDGYVLTIERDVWDIYYQVTTETVSYTISAETVINGSLEVGLQIELGGTNYPDGTSLVDYVTTYYERSYHSGTVLEYTADMIVIEQEVSNEVGEWTVESITYTISPETVISGEVYVGGYVDIYGQKTPDGLLTADTIYNFYDPSYDNSYYGYGEIVEITDDSVTLMMTDAIDGELVTLQTDAYTTFEGPYSVGAAAWVYGYTNSENVLVANSIYAEYQSVYTWGQIVEATADYVVIANEVWNWEAIYLEPNIYEPTFSIEVVTYTVNANTAIDGPYEAGVYATANGYVDPASGELIASYVYAYYESVYVEGYITEITEGSITIDQQLWDETVGDYVTQSASYLITADTTVESAFVAGDHVNISAQKMSDGTFSATYISLYREYVYAYGTVQNVSDSSITVENQWSEYDENGVEMVYTYLIDFVINETTYFETLPAIGDLVTIDGELIDGVNHANYIYTYNMCDPFYGGGSDCGYYGNYVYAEGVITEASSESFTIEKSEYLYHPEIGQEEVVTTTQTFLLTADSYINGELVVGSYLYVEGYTQEDGTTVANSVYVYTDSVVDDNICFSGIIDQILAGEGLIIDGTYYPFSASIDVNGSLNLAEGQELYVTLNGEGMIEYIESISAPVEPVEPTTPLEFYSNQTWFVMDSVIEMTETNLVIKGDIVNTGMAQIIGQIEVGSIIYMSAHRGDSSEPWTADYIEVLSVVNSGIVEDINNNIITVNGVDYNTGDVKLMDQLSVGTEVIVGQNGAGARAAGTLYIKKVVTAEKVPTAITFNNMAANTTSYGMSALVVLCGFATAAYVVSARRKEDVA